MSDDESEYEFSGGSDIEQDFEVSGSELSSSSDELETDIDEIIEMITLETNRYAQQSLDGRPSTSSSTWTDVTSAEIRVFLALIVLQSVVKSQR
ncbi:Transposase IS4 [Popillia japonica]|uniref:Transposase IS4 n=1 Tax=Popillia japonica TaxID=7064 RepID=A0AAW1MJG7_POPJA